MPLNPLCVVKRHLNDGTADYPSCLLTKTIESFFPEKLHFQDKSNFAPIPFPKYSEK